jgi:hypothetical protein
MGCGVAEPSPSTVPSTDSSKNAGVVWLRLKGAMISGSLGGQGGSFGGLFRDCSVLEDRVTQVRSNLLGDV